MSDFTQVIERPRSPRWFWLTFFAIFIAAILLRSCLIDVRPMHNDEGVNYHFVKDTLSLGYYPYSHENYHGPIYFYFTTLLVQLFGTSELVLRMSGIIPGMLLILGLLFLRKDQGDRFVLIAAALFCLSSDLTFYSRYAIHEMLFALGGFWFALSVYRWWQDYSTAAVYSGFLSLVLLVSTKETFIITLASVFVGLLALGRFFECFKQVKQQGALLFRAAFLALVLTALIFSGGFAWGGGLREMLLAVPQWIGRNQSDVGHFKPFAYYAKMLLVAEPQVFLALLLPLSTLLINFRETLTLYRERTGAFGRFCLAWGLASFLIYSFVSYKTPWLIVNSTVPLLMALAWTLDRLLARSSSSRSLAICSLLLVLAVAAFSVIRFNFVLPYGQNNPFSYVQTTQGMVDVVGRVKEIWKTKPKARLLVSVASYWPLPYYFREHSENLAYLNSRTPQDFAKEYDIMIFDRDVIWDNPSWERTYYRLSDVQEAQLYIKR